MFTFMRRTSINSMRYTSSLTNKKEYQKESDNSKKKFKVLKVIVRVRYKDIIKNDYHKTLSDRED
jgi:hypothetical protein